MSPGHLARRFVGSLRPGGPPAAADQWARGWLLTSEAALWAQLSGPDRRHAVGVARQVTAQLGEPPRPVVAAALLHDVGKLVSGLGTFRRVAATFLGLVAGRDRVGGRMGDYLRHPRHGARLLTEAGSDPLTVAWAAEHHLPQGRWSVDPTVAAALHAADDD